jgi:DNA polymerase III alpha subunit (gram-positive type)
MAFKPEKVREIYSIPQSLDIVALLPVGYPADDVEINPLHTKFVNMEDMVSYNEL